MNHKLRNFIKNTSIQLTKKSLRWNQKSKVIAMHDMTIIWIAKSSTESAKSFSLGVSEGHMPSNRMKNLVIL